MPKEEPTLFARPERESDAHGSFAATPFRPRTRPSQASVRQQQNQQEALLLAHQKRRGERKPTADRMERTTTFPRAQPDTALTTDRCAAPHGRSPRPATAAPNYPAVPCRAVLTRLPAGLVAAARTTGRAKPKETHGRKSTTACSTSTAKSRVRPGQRASGGPSGVTPRQPATCGVRAHRPPRSPACCHAQMSLIGA